MHSASARQIRTDEQFHTEQGTDPGRTGPKLLFDIRRDSRDGTVGYARGTGGSAVAAGCAPPAVVDHHRLANASASTGPGAAAAGAVRHHAEAAAAAAEDDAVGRIGWVPGSDW